MEIPIWYTPEVIKSWLERECKEITPDFIAEHLQKAFAKGWGSRNAEIATLRTELAAAREDLRVVQWAKEQQEAELTQLRERCAALEAQIQHFPSALNNMTQVEIVDLIKEAGTHLDGHYLWKVRDALAALDAGKGGMMEACSEKTIGGLQAEVDGLKDYVNRLKNDLFAKDAEIQRWQEIQQDELKTNFAAAERCGFWQAIVDGKSYFDAEVECFATLRTELAAARDDLSHAINPMECGHYGANLQTDDSNNEFCMVCYELAQLRERGAKLEAVVGSGKKFSRWFMKYPEWKPGADFIEEFLSDRQSFCDALAALDAGKRE